MLITGTSSRLSHYHYLSPIVPHLSTHAYDLSVYSHLVRHHQRIRQLRLEYDHPQWWPLPLLIFYAPISMLVCMHSYHPSANVNYYYLCAYMFISSYYYHHHHHHHCRSIGLILLVLACPCAIVIATPIPSVAAIAIASRHGTYTYIYRHMNI